MKTHKMRKNKCLNCGYKLDAATEVGGDGSPESGDATICIQCSHLMIFDEDLKLRELNDLEIVELAGDRRMVGAMNAISAVKDV